MSPIQTRGSLPQIIRNDEGLYEGNLVGYFQVVFNQARNLRNPYHNFRHILHVLWLCYQACQFYKEIGYDDPGFTNRSKRNLLIAALFHDFDHLGILGDDDLNVARAIRGLTKHIEDVDRPNLDEIIYIIKATEYPYKIPSKELPMSGRIIRDADLSQVFSVAWIQQIVIGLATEWNKRPIDVLNDQIPFLKSVKFSTRWANEFFPKETIEDKIQEVRELLELLNGNDTSQH